MPDDKDRVQGTGDKNKVQEVFLDTPFIIVSGTDEAPGFAGGIKRGSSVGTLVRKNPQSPLQSPRTSPTSSQESVAMRSTDVAPPESPRFSSHADRLLNSEGISSSSDLRDLRAGSLSPSRGTYAYEWWVKAPNVFTHNPLIHNSPFPADDSILDENQLRDQELSVKKSLVADSIWATFLGLENVAKTRHWKTSIEGGQEQHYMASRIEEDVKGRNIGEITDATHKDKLKDRQPLTEYLGKPVVLAKVDEKPLVGFGAAAAIGIFSGSPDLHPGNFALRETGEKIQLFKFDNKFDLGAHDSFPKQFFDSQRSDYDKSSIMTVNSMFNAQFAEEESGYEVLAAADRNNGGKTRFDFMFGTTCFQLVVELGFDAYDAADKVDAEGFGALKGFVEQFEQSRLIMSSLQSEEHFDKFLSNVFQNKEKYDDEDGLQENWVFNFPFGEDFHEAPHVKEEFLDTMYLIINIGHDKLDTMIKAIIPDHFVNSDESLVSDLISSQLGRNIERLRGIMEKSPVYQKHVNERAEILQGKLAIAERTMEHKAKDLHWEIPPVVQGRKQSASEDFLQRAKSVGYVQRPATKIEGGISRSHSDLPGIAGILSPRTKDNEPPSKGR